MIVFRSYENVTHSYHAGFRIICGWDAREPEEGEEEFLLGSHERAPESLGRFETKRLFADGVQFCDGAFLNLGRLLPGDIAGFKLPSCVAES